LNTFGEVTGETLAKLRGIIGEENVIAEEDKMIDYSHDEMAKDTAISHRPDVVVKPGSTKEVSEIMKIANEGGIPVTPRGAGTGLSGGAVPVLGGIVLSLERLNHILEIDGENLMMVVQAGVSFMDVYEALQKTDLFFPPHPGDESAHIGGAAACNAGGARCVKYGVMRNYVTGARVVLSNGDIVELGGKLLKNNTGYNLLQLLVGSEGTLAVFTEVTLRLLPKPQETVVLLMPYKSTAEAIATVPRVLRSGIVPLGMEFLERSPIEPTERLLGKKWPAKEGEAFLLVILVGAKKEELYSECEKIAAIAQQGGALDVLVAGTKREQDVIMDIRSNLYEGLKPETLEIMDIAVPPSRIPEFVDRVKEASEKYGVKLPTYGHAADGNVHVHIMKSGLKEEDWREKYPRVREELLQAGEELDGVATAEHGVGAYKIGDLSHTLSDREIVLMKGIKRIFDPAGILNPGKVIPSNSGNREDQ